MSVTYEVGLSLTVSRSNTGSWVANAVAKYDSDSEGNKDVVMLGSGISRFRDFAIRDALDSVRRGSALEQALQVTL